MRTASPGLRHAADALAAAPFPDSLRAVDRAGEGVAVRRSAAGFESQPDRRSHGHDRANGLPPPPRSGGRRLRRSRRPIKSKGLPDATGRDRARAARGDGSRHAAERARLRLAERGLAGAAALPEPYLTFLSSRGVLDATSTYVAWRERAHCRQQRPRSGCSTAPTGARASSRTLSLPRFVRCSRHPPPECACTAAHP